MTCFYHFRSSNISDEEAQEVLITLQARGLVKCLSNGNYMRTTKSDTGNDLYIKLKLH